MNSDTVTFEIIRNYLETVSEEVIGTMVRTAVSPIFNEAHDCSAGIFGFDGTAATLIARGDAAPVHVYAALASVQAALDFFEGDLSDGDVIIVCDPYFGGSHLPDYTVLTPVFIDGDPSFFPSVRAHMPDCGGPVAGGNVRARDIWQEGFRFGPMKLYEKGEIRTDVWDWIISNNRLPQNLKADMEAMIGGCRVGASRLRDLCARYGPTCVKDALAWILDYSEKRVRSSIRQWPNGTYRAASYLDTDFAGGRDVELRVSVVVHDDEVSVDFTGSSPQTRGIVNSVPANTLAFVYCAFSALCPDVPINSGFFRPIRVVMPPATVVNCDPPAPVRANTITVGADIGDVVMKAAEGFAADRVGTCSIDLLAPWFWGRDERGAKPFVHYELLCTPTASGGVYGADGWGAFPATFASADVPTVEMSELQYPVLYRQGEFSTDSAAPGEWRGSAAWITQRQVYRAEGLVSHTIRIQGCVWPLHGFCGGRPAGGNYCITAYGTERARVIAEFTDGETCEADEIVFFQSGGGGGWGDPLARDLERVRRDVLDEYVSISGAWHDYGVRIDPESLDVDVERTLEERERLRRARSDRPGWLASGRMRTLGEFPAELRHDIEDRVRRRNGSVERAADDDLGC